MAEDKVLRRRPDELARTVRNLLDAYNAHVARMDIALSNTEARLRRSEEQIEALDEALYEVAIAAPTLLAVNTKQALEEAKAEWKQRFEKSYNITREQTAPQSDPRTSSAERAEEEPLYSLPRSRPLSRDD